MAVALQVLIVEDCAGDAEQLVEALGRGGYAVEWERVQNTDELSAALDEASWDIVIADYGTQSDHRIDGLGLLRTRRLDVPYILVLESLDEALAVAAMHEGAHDYVMKDHAARLAHAIERGRQESEERRIRREAEEALRASDERYRELVENANDIIFTADLEGNFTSLNRAGERVSGYSRDEICRMNMEQVMTPHSLDVAREMIREKIASNQPTWTELELVSRDGHHVMLEASTRLLMQGGQPAGIHGIARDITARRRAEEELRARERKQAAVAELGQDALAGANLSELFDQATYCVASTLGLEFCMLTEYVPELEVLRARAGTGWKPGVLDGSTVPAGTGSQGGYALLSAEPVIVENLRVETRFEVPAVLTEHGISSGISVIVHGHSRPFGVLSVFSCDVHTFTQDDVHFLQSVAHVLSTASERKRMEEEQRQHGTELASRCIAAQEEERKRIARELHDETAQALSTLLINLDLLEKYIPHDNRILQEGIARVEALARRALDETRALSHDLRPTILDDVGLVAAIHWFANEYTDRFGGEVDVEVEPPEGAPLSPEVEVTLFRIVQEALNNCGKHAAAAMTRVTLSVSGEGARVLVEDNGRGFDPERVPGPTREGRLGLYGMRERAALLGGQLTIISAPGQGTTIMAELPCGLESDEGQTVTAPLRAGGEYA